MPHDSANHRVLILTAVDDEFAALTNIIKESGVLKTTLEHTGSIAKGHRLLNGDDARVEFTIARCNGMGVDETVSDALIHYKNHYYNWLMMTGVCAGRPEKTKGGDILFSTASWKFGPGKTMVQRSSTEARTLRKRHVQIHEIFPEQLPRLAYDFAPLFLSTWTSTLKHHWPSEANTTHDPRVALSAFHTVSDVTIDDQAFSDLDLYRRDTDAIDMESYGIALAAKKLDVSGWMVIKGVQDHARPAFGRNDKNDLFRMYAAAAAGLFGVAFVLHLLSSGSDRKINSTSIRVLPTGMECSEIWLRRVTLGKAELVLVEYVHDAIQRSSLFVRLTSRSICIPMPERINDRLYISRTLVDIARRVNGEGTDLTPYLIAADIQVVE